MKYSQPEFKINLCTYKSKYMKKNKRVIPNKNEVEKSFVPAIVVSCLFTVSAIITEH